MQDKKKPLFSEALVREIVRHKIRNKKGVNLLNESSQFSKAALYDDPTNLNGPHCLNAKGERVAAEPLNDGIWSAEYNMTVYHVCKIKMSAEEQAEHDKDIAYNSVKLQEEQEAEQTKEDLKASAKAKLIAGEKLTEEEANILVGV